MAAVTLKIDGQDKTSFLQAKSLVIQQRLNSPTTCECVVKDPSGLYRPIIGQALVIDAGTVRLFAGSIQEVPESRYTPAGGLEYSIAGVDHSYLLVRHLVGTAVGSAGWPYKDEAAGQIVKDIVNNTTWLVADGVTANNVEDGPVIKKITFDGHTAAEAFKELATIAGFAWWIDSAKDVHFKARASEPAPFSLTTLAQLYSMVVRNTRENYANRVWLRFAFEAISPAVESFVGDGVATSFLLSRPVALLVGITLNGAEQTFATRSEDPPPLVHWFWELGEELLTQGAAAVSSAATLTFTGQPANGQTVTINGKAYTLQTTLTDIDGNVKIGAATQETAGNLKAAINLEAGAGTSYAASTTIHPSVTASLPITTAVMVATTVPGAELTVSETLNNATWSSPSSSILTADDVLAVTYRPLFTNQIFASNEEQVAARIAAEGGSGFYEAFYDRTDLIDADSVTQTLAALIRRDSVLPQTIEFETGQAGLNVNQLLTVLLPVFGLDGQYLIETLETRDNDGLRLRYRAGAVVAEKRDGLVEFFEALRDGGGSGGAIGGGGTGRGEDFARFHIPRKECRVEDDAVHGYHIVARAGRPKAAQIVCDGNAPTGASLIADMKYKNPGVGSVFSTVFAGEKLVVPDGVADVAQLQTTFASPLPLFEVGCLIRFDVVQVGSTQPGGYVSARLDYA